MENLVRILASARADKESAQSAVKLMQEELEKTDEWQRLRLAKENLSLRNDDESKLDDQLRDTAIKQYELDKNKHPHSAVSIGEYDVLEYDPGSALIWCVEKDMRKALKLDKRQFENIAKIMEPEFVTMEKEPRAKIKTDLSEYLDDQD